MIYAKLGKRALDVALAGGASLVLLPITAVISVLVRIKLGSPVLFAQERPGQGARSFTMVKFRTMTDATDREGNLLPDAQRLTRFGAFLRSTSLDELPSLWNIVKGDMSVVGPRPLLVRYLPLYSERQSRRHEVRPGLTGWAQVNGRNALDWDSRFELDVWYVDNISFMLDVRIIWKTLWSVVRREGISGDGEATMTEFRGSGEH